MGSMQPGYELARVMVTVKTYPTPSDKYGETVCVAGVRLDTPAPEWIRLYPMKFRLVDYEQQFRKYEIIEIPVLARGSLDPRPESMRPDQSGLRSIERLDTRQNWGLRRRLIGPLVGATTTCELIAENKAVDYSQPAPSLGLVKVADVDVRVFDGEPWDERQKAKVVKAAMPDLFNPDGLRELEPAPFRVQVKYRCESAGCSGHAPHIIDWETGQAGRSWSRSGGPEKTKRDLLDKYEAMFTPDHDSHIYVGNLHLHRESFSALGVWYPRKSYESETDALF